MKATFVLFFFLGICLSCSQVIEIDRPFENPKIIVNALFTPDSTWQVYITKSRDILDLSSYFEPVNDAIVSIHDENNFVIETLSYSSDKWFRFRYAGNTVPEAGRTYLINVQLYNQQNLQAINHVPIPTPISSVVVDSSRFKANGENIEMNIGFKDPEGFKNYYCIKILRDAYYLQNEDTIRFVEDVHFEPIDPVFNNDYAAGLTTLFNDNLFDGMNFEFRLKLSPFFNFGTTEGLRAALLTVSEDYYQYFTTKNLQNNKREDPFAQPTQVFSNIKNGIGIFAGFSRSEVKLE